MLSLLVACESLVPPGDSEDVTRSDLTPLPACEAVFSPVDSLRDAAEEAALRWSLATECDVTVGDGGVPIERALSLPFQEGGAQAPGWTRADRQLVLINQRTGGDQLYRCMAHEMGHALGGLHTETDGVLSGSKVRRDVIDEAALDTVCRVLPCRGRHPEGR